MFKHLRIVNNPDKSINRAVSTKLILLMSKFIQQIAESKGDRDLSHGGLG